MNNTPKLQIIVAGDSPICRSLVTFLKSKSFSVASVESDITSLKDNRADLILIFTGDNLQEKVHLISSLKQQLKNGGLMCINLDSGNLLELQKQTQTPLLGLNLNYPAMKSLFMEIISTKENSPDQIEFLKSFGVDILEKDPYLVKNGISARAHMLAAMTREALFLVDGGYASIESIDRACRNDAGYYLPFTGNFLYMDLMGTMAYALVMKDINPDLSTSANLPDWFIEKVESGKIGMQAGEGLYSYKKGDLEKWEELLVDFSIEINAMINRNIQHYQKRLYHGQKVDF